MHQKQHYALKLIGTHVSHKRDTSREGNDENLADKKKKPFKNERRS